MKAAIVRSPGHLTVEDIPVPAVSEYDALCELLYGATCAGTDLHLIGGEFPWPISYPTILGHESIGRVVEVGAKVKNFRVGDLVTRAGTPPPPGSGLDANWGGFAEFGIAKDHWAMSAAGLPPAEYEPFTVNQLLPPATDPAAATMFITWRETLSFITRMGVGPAASGAPGARVLVVGSGGNGLAFVAHAALLGAAEVLMVGSPARADSARAAGATHFLDYRTEDIAAQIGAKHPQGFDFVIDAVGKKETPNIFLPLLRPGGSLAIYGLDDFHQTALNPNLARGTFTYFNGGYNEAEVHSKVLDWFRTGKLDPTVWLELDNTFPLADITAAFDAVRTRKQIKALVRLSASA